jgi:hypothetical protein
VPDLIGSIGRTSWGEDPFRRKILAEALHKGQLTLFLGAGVSRPLKLPLWHQLVAACAKKVGLHALAARINSGTPSEELRKAFDKIHARHHQPEEVSDMLETVSEGLYHAIANNEGAYPTKAVLNPLLVGLGALTMNSSRGSVSEIVTLNFDDLLEWFLDLHGFSTQVVTEYPTLLRTDIDVRIFHPHGFVPLRKSVYQSSDFFVLSQKQYLDRMADDASPWSLLLYNMFISKVILFVGTKVDDPDIQLLLKRAEKTLGGKRPFGYLLTRRAGLTEGRIREIRDCNLEPLPVHSYRTSAHLDLLRICQDAAGRAR